MAILAVDELMLREPRLMIPAAQPLGLVCIDPAHQLSNGLVLCIPDINYRIPARGPLVTGGGTITQKIRAGVRCLTVASAVLNYVFGAIPGDFSAAVGYIGTPTDANIRIALAGYSGGGTTRQWRLQPNYNGTSTQAGAFVFTTYRGAFISAGDNGLITGRPQIMLGVRRGNDHELWVDGRLRKTTSATPHDLSDLALTTVYGSGYGGAYVSEEVFLAMQWSRALTQGEAQSFTRDPYQFLVPA